MDRIPAPRGEPASKLLPMPRYRGRPLPTANHHFRFRAFAHDHLLVTTFPNRLDPVHFARVTGGPVTGYSVPEAASDASPRVQLFLSDAHARTHTLYRAFKSIHAAIDQHWGSTNDALCPLIWSTLLGSRCFISQRITDVFNISFYP